MKIAMTDAERETLDNFIGAISLTLAGYISFVVFESYWLWILIHTFVMVLWHSFFGSKKAKKAQK